MSRGARAILALGACLLGLGSCIPRVALNSDLTSWQPPVNQLSVEHVDWFVNLVRPGLLEFSPSEYAAPALDETGELIVALTRDGKVHAIDVGMQGGRAVGTERWTFDAQNRFIAAATIRAGVVYVPGGDGVLYALDARTGKPRWSYASGEELVTSPTVTDKVVLVSSQSDTLFAVNREDGKWIWQYRRESAASYSIRGASGAAVRGDIAYCGFSDGHLVALQLADGQVKWDQALSPGGQFGDIDTTPLLTDDGRLFVASYRDGLYELALDTGATRWQNKVAGITRITRKGGILFAAGADRVEAHILANGQLLWSLMLKDKAAQEIAVAQRVLAIPTGGELLFVDTLTGKRLMEWDPGKGVTAPAVWNHGALYVLSNAGSLYALDVPVAH